MNLLKTTAICLLVLGIFSVAVLACGPADESVQRQIGNLPAQEATLVPIPTVCVDIPGETAEAGPTTECFTPSPTPLPPKYTKLDRELNEMVERVEAEAERRAARNEPSATKMPPGSGVAVRIYAHTDSQVTSIKEWLESEGAEVKLGYNGEGEKRFAFLLGHIDAKLLVPLALREEIIGVQMQGENVNW